MTPDEALPELKVLTRGRGLQASDLPRRLGPALTMLAGTTDADTPAQLRSKVTQRLVEMCARLPDDLRVAALAALNLHGPAERSLLKDRLAWVADVTGSSPRSTRRHVDHALRLLSEEVDKQPRQAAPGSSWYTDSVRALLRMDTDPPQLTEERRIVAAAHRVDEITMSITIPDTPENAQNADTSILYGGRITRIEQLSRSHTKVAIQLPRTLNRGEHHEYGVQFALPPGREMRPFYVLTPVRQVSAFDVRVRFDTERCPKVVWRISDLPPRVVDDAEPGGDLLDVDPIGEVASNFSGLQPGRSYGIQWAF